MPHPLCFQARAHFRLWPLMLLHLALSLLQIPLFQLCLRLRIRIPHRPAPTATNADAAQPLISLVVRIRLAVQLSGRPHLNLCNSARHSAWSAFHRCVQVVARPTQCTLLRLVKFARSNAPNRCHAVGRSNCFTNSRCRYGSPNPTSDQKLKHSGAFAIAGRSLRPSRHRLEPPHIAGPV